MLYHDHAQSLYVEHKLPRCTSCSGTLAYSAKTPKQIYLSTAGKGLSKKHLSPEKCFFFLRKNVSDIDALSVF